MHAAAPTVPASPPQYPSFPFLTFCQDNIQGEDAQRSNRNRRCKYLPLYVPLSLPLSLALSLSLSLFLSLFLPTLYPSLITEKDTSYERREAKWWRVEGHRKSMRVTKVIKKSNAVHKSAENNGTMMVSGSQRKSTRAFGAQKSMEVNKSQRNKLVARELAEVNEGQRESTWVPLSTPQLSQAGHWMYLSSSAFLFFVN